MQIDAPRNDEVAPLPEPAPIYDGSWEQGGRSPSSAAVLGLLGVGVLYFNTQTILAVIAIGIAHALNPDIQLTGNYFERIASISRLYADPIRLALVISQYLFMLLPAWWLVRRWHTKRVREYIRLQTTPVLEIFLAVLATAAFIPTGTYIANALTNRLKIPDFLIKINSELFTAYSLGEFMWLAFVIAVTPAICEEIFFRGFAQRNFERSLSGNSVWLIGVIFGLFHMQPLGLITISLLGILFGYFYYRSKSLLPSMAAHFTNNFIAIFILYKSPRLDDVALASTEQIPISWVLVTAPLAGAILFLYHLVTRRKIISDGNAP
jgi:hypothetical protein